MLINYDGSSTIEELTEGKVSLLDFYAMHCGPCRMMLPFVEQIGNETDYVVIKIDTDDYPEIASKYDVVSIPQLVFIDSNGNTSEVTIGAKPKNFISSKLEELA